VTELRVGPLVRATDASRVTIWTEWAAPCEVVLRVCPDGCSQEQGNVELICQMHTVCVGDRHYAVLHVGGLQTATWYSYSVASLDEDLGQVDLQGESGLMRCFRTLDASEAEVSLRLAYGSCRKLSATEPDALSAFGYWLRDSFDERETVWPRLLLLVGDQIYADEYGGRRKQVPASFQDEPAKRRWRGAQTFAEFASLYEETWTCDEGIRQVLAVLPTFTIFDDHDVINSWNLFPGWRERVLKAGGEQVLVDGLVAYWVYQGWGNLSDQKDEQPALLAIMQRAGRSGEDALEELRACIRREVYGEVHLCWHYDIPTRPTIFVADVRADRPAIFGETGAVYEPARIMSVEQMGELQEWMRRHDEGIAILVSSVPVLLPSLIGFAEYVMGLRPFRGAAPLQWLGRWLAAILQRLARRMSFEHWPVFSATWRELVGLLRVRRHDVVVLSGDVHFSYAMQAWRGFVRSRRQAVLYQLVSTPFGNELSREDKRLIVGQAWIKQLIYGGLRVRVLPLFAAGGKRRIRHDLLFQNTVAMVTFTP